MGLKLRVKVEPRPCAWRNYQRNLKVLQRRQVLFQDLSINKIVLPLSEHQRGVIKKHNSQRIVSNPESKSDAESFNRSVSLARVLMNHHNNTRRHESSGKCKSVEGNKAITSIDHVREDDKPAERHSLIETIGRNTMLLASVGTDEQLGASSREFQEAIVSHVSHTLIDQIEIDVYVGPQCLLAKTRDRRDARVGRGCG